MGTKIPGKTRLERAAQLLDLLDSNATIAQQPALWAQYEGAYKMLRTLGYEIKNTGGKHKVMPYADPKTSR